MIPTISRAEWKWAAAVSVLIVFLATAPYLLGWVLAPAGTHFTGLLINPVDGHSYLAKMGQGAMGEWLFRIPYTAEPHQPVLVYTFYLLLGHLAIGGSPTMLLAVYHVARIVFGLLLLLGVYAAAAYFSDHVRQRRWTLLLVGLSSGLGWLFSSTPDLLVPESVTFASLLVNAHFALTYFLILLLIVTITLGTRHWTGWVLVASASVALVMIQPFAIPVVGLAAGGYLLFRWLHQRFFSWLLMGRLALFVACVLPFGIYFLWVSQNHTQVARWMAQNITPAPALWQWLAAYGLLWPLAAAGAWCAFKRRRPADWLLLSWAGGQLLLMVVPFSLQRRMSTALHLPLCFLAAEALQYVVWPSLRGRARRWLVPAVFVLSFPSNLVLSLAGVSAVVNQNPYTVLTSPQWEAMQWLRESSSSETVVMTDEELGTVAPALGNGVRVLYGHPFETPDAEQMRQLVNDFYTGRLSAEARSELLAEWGVEIIILQQDRYQIDLPATFVERWRSDPLVIYQLEDS